MELKLRIVRHAHHWSFSSNRTFMELKQMFVVIIVIIVNSF